MASLKFRVDFEEENRHGQFVGKTRWIGGPSPARIRNCRCQDGIDRTAYITGEPDTWWTTPARINIGKRSVRGYLTCEDGLWEFHQEG